MFSTKWETSKRKYSVIVEHDVRIPMSDGTEISADIFHPDSDEKFPAIFGFHPYEQAPQTAPMKPTFLTASGSPESGQEKGNGSLEAGDPNFFVRRGYAHIIANVRGTGKSGGKYAFVGLQETKDGYEVIEWIARQPWCDGNVGMFGVSYFGWIQLFIAALNPPHLKCIFSPWASTDFYRDAFYHGGIFSYFPIGWHLAFSNPRFQSCSRKELGDNKFKEAVSNALQDDDIKASPALVNILNNPDIGPNPFILDFILNPLYGPLWEERRVKYEAIKVPAYIGACWGNYGLHLPAAFRSWENLKVPKKMIIGPPMYMDRPVYQLQYESLRWFDYHLKGIDTGIMDEPPIRLFVPGSNEWKQSNEWPLPDTKWTPFYLHEDKLLFEHEHWPNEGQDSFEDSPWQRGYLEYYSPQLVENTEIIGPIVLNLHASTTNNEVLWFISIREVDPQGNERILTRGWLRGTHLEVEPKYSKPWEPFHPHTKSAPLSPGKIYEFNIPLVPTCKLFKAGYRIGLRISCTDDEPKFPQEVVASRHIRSQSPSRITVYHNADYPSHLLLPITKGNVIGTYLSGGQPYMNTP